MRGGSLCVDYIASEIIEQARMRGGEDIREVLNSQRAAMGAVCAQGLLRGRTTHARLPFGTEGCSSLQLGALCARLHKKSCRVAQELWRL